MYKSVHTKTCNTSNGAEITHLYCETTRNHPLYLKLCLDQPKKYFKNASSPVPPVRTDLDLIFKKCFIFNEN